jgi:hypothetical protein
MTATLFYVSPIVPDEAAVVAINVEQMPDRANGVVTVEQMTILSASGFFRLEAGCRSVCCGNSRYATADSEGVETLSGVSPSADH